MSGRPIAVASGTNAGTAVYNGSATIPAITNPAIVDNAGGLSAYGTMGQGGNVWEWIESASDGTNNSPSEQRTVRGGSWDSGERHLRSPLRENVDPTVERDSYGFRVASVPEPSTYVLVLMGAGALYLWKRRKSSL
jgi:formylglycine-generating enzyme